MKKYLSVLVVVVFSIFSLSTFSAGRDQISKKDIEVPCEMDIKKVGQAIRAGLARRKWITVSKKDNSVVGTIYVRSHILSMKYIYDTEKIMVRYHSSENLKYKKKRNGVEVIHGKAVNWIRYVDLEIRRALAAHC